jgi:hypothetical protein
MLADQKHYEIAGRVVVNASDEGVAALDAMHEAIVAEEIERTVNGDRRRPAATHGRAIHNLIGAERLVALQQNLENLAADRRQPLRALRAQHLGVLQRVSGAALMIVVGGVENWL